MTHTAVREFWSFLDTALTTAEKTYLPDIVANLVDDYRYLSPFILRDAERDPARKALLDRAEAVNGAAPLRWADGICNMEWWLSDVEAIEMDEPYTERKKKGEGQVPF